MSTQRWIYLFRGPKALGYRNTRIPHSGPAAQDKAFEKPWLADSLCLLRMYILPYAVCYIPYTVYIIYRIRYTMYYILYTIYQIRYTVYVVFWPPIVASAQMGSGVPDPWSQKPHLRAASTSREVSLFV